MFIDSRWEKYDSKVNNRAKFLKKIISNLIKVKISIKPGLLTPNPSIAIQ
jgi:hypothetical protein